MKSIFITGASKGIGRAAAVHFLDRGWFVGATDIDEVSLNQLKEESHEKNIHTAVLDVTREQDVKIAIKNFCRHTGGKLHVLLNNAGVGWLGNFEEIPLQQQLSIIEVNNIGVLNCAYHAFPFLKQTEDARVINMCSAAAHYGVPFAVTYSASKFFVKGVTEALNLEWEKYGIYVCDLMPNFVRTPMMEEITSTIVKNVGIKLTTDDVVKKIWKAAHKKKVHWLVEFFPYNILQPLSSYLPRIIVRMIMKRKAEL